MDPMETEQGFPTTVRVPAHIGTGDFRIDNFWGLTVVPCWPALGLLSSLMTGGKNKSHVELINSFRKK